MKLRFRRSAFLALMLLFGLVAQVPSQPTWSECQTQVEFQKPGAESVPYDRMRDAARAHVEVLFNFAFFGVKELLGYRLDALQRWTEVLTKYFPLEENRKALTLLLQNMKQRPVYTKDQWKDLIHNWQEEVSTKTVPEGLFHSKHPYTSCEGYPCALWTLFHMVTVNVGSAARVPAGGDSQSCSASESWEIASIIREFIEKFYPCDDCRNHFLKYNPPSRLENIRLAGDVRQCADKLILWMWTNHNGVNKALNKPQWPTEDDCPSCRFNTDPLTGKVFWNEDEVIMHIRCKYSVPGDTWDLSMRASQNPWVFVSLRQCGELMWKQVFGQ